MIEAADSFLRELTQDVKEQRLAVRRRSTQAIVVLADSSRMSARLVDISDTGAKFQAPKELLDGQRVTMEFEDQTSVTAKIVWLRDGFAGAQFDRPLSSIAFARAA